jgi:HD-GYP domain-containing protein (c-di-GMP phosphodiesterase class II)
MNFSLTELTIALSHALDFMEIDFLGGVTYHSKRVAYIALRLGEARGLHAVELSDLVSLAILHDNGIGVAFQAKSAASSAPADRLGAIESAALHCSAGEENLRGFPLLSLPSDVILNHHENWDGSGFFHVQGEGIPLMARLIRLADLVDQHCRLDGIDYAGKSELLSWIEMQKGITLDPELVDSFVEVSGSPAFWLDLKNDFIREALRRRIPRFSREMDFGSIRDTTSVFSRIIDSKSRFTRMHSQELSEKALVMASRYGYGPDERAKLRIAADLHDVGKLAVSNAILDKNGPLESVEVDAIQRHTYYTRVSLQEIHGFEEITEWAANHHEKLDGSGYPFRLPGERLDFNSRLLCCLDIYQALTELRPYREALSHEKALGIMQEMVGAGKLDSSIVEDIGEVFGRM